MAFTSKFWFKFDRLFEFLSTCIMLTQLAELDCWRIVLSGKCLNTPKFLAKFVFYSVSHGGLITRLVFVWLQMFSWCNVTHLREPLLIHCVLSFGVFWPSVLSRQNCQKSAHISLTVLACNNKFQWMQSCLSVILLLVVHLGLRLVVPHCPGKLRFWFIVCLSVNGWGNITFDFVLKIHFE